MKKTWIVVVGLSAVLALSGCSGKKDDTTIPENTEPNTTQTTQNGETPTENGGATGETTGNTTENTTGEKDNTARKDVAGNGELTRENVYNLMSASDYISRVKVSRLANGETELKILDNYKGSLSNIEFAPPEGLDTDKEYLIFYRDDEDGEIVATSSEIPTIEVAGKNDTILDYVERTYNSNSKPEKSSTSSTTSEKTDSSKTDGKKEN